MPTSVKSITLWRTEVTNQPGALAGVLGPLAQAGADLSVVMGYRYPGESTKAAVEIYPVSGKKPMAAAQQAGLSAAALPSLLVEGDNKPGLGHAIAQAVAAAGVNMSFLVAQVVGRKYQAVIGFESDADAKKASGLIKKATAGKKK